MTTCEKCGSEIPIWGDKFYVYGDEIKRLTNGKVDLGTNEYWLCDQCYGDILEVMKKERVGYPEQPQSATTGRKRGKKK